MKVILDYYRTHGSYSSPGETGLLPGSLAANIKTLAGIVQANMIHGHWLQRYNLEIDPVRRERELNLRTFKERISNIVLNGGAFALDKPFPNEKKSIGTCRDFTVMLTALLREKGIPARSYCGFGTYFTPGKFEDHWICEWWNESDNRWVLTDGQIDEMQYEILKLDFNVLDMPRNRFIDGGQAWRMVRREGSDPDLFGIFEWRGMDFIKGNLIRHFASLRKVPMLPWDSWGLMNTPFTALSSTDLEFLDEVADLLADPDGNFDRLARIYNTDSRVRMPGRITSYCDGKETEVRNLPD